MGASHTIIKKDQLELAIDADSFGFDISMGTGFTSGAENSVNIEIKKLTLAELTEVAVRLLEVVSSYNPDVEEALQLLKKEE